MVPRSRPINTERSSATVRGPEPNPLFPGLKKHPNVSLARWLGGVRFDHHCPSLLKEGAGLCQAAPRRVLFQAAGVLSNVRVGRWLRAPAPSASIIAAVIFAVQRFLLLHVNAR